MLLFGNIAWQIIFAATNNEIGLIPYTLQNVQKKEVPTLSSFWQFGPHFLDSLQHHVAVTVKSLHPSQQLLVVPETFHEKETIFRTTCS